MRIAIDIRKIGKQSTGSEVVFYYLIKEIAGLKKSAKNKFYLLTDGDISLAKKALGPLPKNFEIHKVAPTSKLFWTFYSLPRFLKKHSIDIYHTEYIVPFYLTRKIKIVTIIHDISFKINPVWITKKDNYVLNTLIPPSIRRADAIIAVSNFTKKEIIENYGVSESKIFVASPAVDNRHFSVVSENEARKKIAKIVGGNFPFILHISSLQPRKNVPLVVSAFAKLKNKWEKSGSEMKNIKLVIVGKKGGYNYDQGIEKTISENVKENKLNANDIIITGYQPAENLPYFYKAALCFVFPSAYEGFGIPLIEAMASGTPVVASDIAVFREVAEKAVIFADINKKDSARVLAEAIEKIIENKKFREVKIKLGLERASFYSWKKMAETTQEIYEKLADKTL